MVTSRIWLRQRRRPSFGSDGSKVRAFRRSRGHWTAGTRPAFSGSYPYTAALLPQQGVEQPRRSGWRSAKRSLAGSRRVSRYALLHEVSGDPHRQYVGRSLAMAVHKRIAQPGPTSRLGSARYARSNVAWRALDGYGGGWRKSWRCNGRRSRLRAG
jgi:hypothetical protein